MRPVPVALPPGILGRLIGSLAPDRIILFGSHAQGTAGPGSDIDLLLVGVWKGNPARVLRQARQLVAHSFPPVDLVLCTPADMIEAERGKAPFLRSVIESGVVIWHRPG